MGFDIRKWGRRDWWRGGHRTVSPSKKEGGDTFGEPPFLRVNDPRHLLLLLSPLSTTLQGHTHGSIPQSAESYDSRRGTLLSFLPLPTSHIVDPTSVGESEINLKFPWGFVKILLFMCFVLWTTAQEKRVCTWGLLAHFKAEDESGNCFESSGFG
jgi:hypothetical protein